MYSNNKIVEKYCASTVILGLSLPHKGSFIFMETKFVCMLKLRTSFCISGITHPIGLKYGVHLKQARPVF